MSAPLGAIARPYLLFLGDAPDRETAKTAIGVHHWRGRDCAAQFSLPGCNVDLGLPELDPAAAAARGICTLLVGLAPLGGAIPEHWTRAIVAALEAGLDVASGLHVRLGDVPAIAAAAARHQRRLIDVRHPERLFSVGDYRRRNGKRLLTVGTDCAVGKMFTALALEQAMRRRGIAADFRATGQTGIFIAGGGVSVDAVVSDFLSGAAESLSPDAADMHWDLVEGQGSLFHPSYAGVSLGLLHGSQPDAIVLCHDAGRRTNGDFPGLPLPSLAECAQTNLQLARLTNPAVRLVGCSLNTSRLTPDATERAIADAATALGVPCVDPVRTGVDPIVDHILAR
ncbi:DUF1611 domain-containing protein [Sphingomonas colocasiae]|uniref:DUF1611 domain-containing protein n=1 Tax=Sphingomonas colocasiae TaxID=1848973 RepID=A0ABS7PUJ3_9SPHN|nr:DUF1611 domain-containing protein [Sphingomonas colocasiae]MBY8825023.1 DUF1611 domain-containing protein [Sphingomonas colocasiae]